MAAWCYLVLVLGLVQGAGPGAGAGAACFRAWRAAVPCGVLLAVRLGRYTTVCAVRGKLWTQAAQAWTRVAMQPSEPGCASRADTVTCRTLLAHAAGWPCPGRVPLLREPRHDGRG